ncbi:MAG: phosphate ABC transporter substrate-binding protein PstS [Actinomycetota bacterium]|nr:phosphate ABC transporter substrate-binding protein PstS [Actinomycetota bacterium]
MQPKRRFMWLLALLAAFSLVAAACGDDDDDDAGEDTDTTEEDSGEETTDDTEATEDEGGEDEGAMDMDLSGTLDGAGASSQAAAMQGWQAGFQGQYPDVTVNYDPIGSGGGRERFLSGATSFAGSDAIMDEEEYASSVERCPGDQGAIHLPHYISPVAAAFNIDGIDSLNLAPEVLAGIFAETITNWNDPAIAEDNPDVELPDLAITPVHRSDESGTTENFTDYLAVVAPDVWTFGPVESWPGELGGEGGAQTSGVVQAVQAGNGAIGYADASQIGDLGVVAVGVGEEFVEYSPEAAARIVDVSERIEGNSEYDFAYELQRDTTESGTYPIALVSYHIVCLEYDDQEELDLVKAFMLYIGSPEGQDASAESAGSAPISDELRGQLEEAVNAIALAG